MILVGFNGVALNQNKGDENKSNSVKLKNMLKQADKSCERKIYEGLFNKAYLFQLEL